MPKSKIALIVFLCAISIVALSFFFGGLDLALMKTFLPAKENVRREVFENTKSYTHGKIQDLAKYYEEYQNTEDKEAVAAIIKMRFSDFDAEKINSLKLKSFLLNVRGY